MSEPKLISPMLDNFLMGDSISEHDGVQCCPAINNETDERYIVKIISVPASQNQVDALLLSGAFNDQDAALAYFKSTADGIVDETDILKKLSQIEGFVPIENCQVIPMDDGCGYDVYLLSAYRNTLRNYLRRGSMTHLQAINLGLDLCAALSAARRMGYLYVNLKPSNIYINGTQEFRIGDIGFVNLGSLQYTSLPDRYRSEYTAPEIADAYSDLNKTIDVYSLGLIMYQVFNDGLLPASNSTPDPLPAPAYADYEMAEIILKACANNPAERWQDPAEMGQALVNYMQRNGAHDTPIVPVVDDTVSPEISSDEEPEGLYEEHSNNETDTADDKAQAEQADDTIIIVSNSETEEIPSEEPITEEAIFTEDSEGNLTLLEESEDETVAPEDAGNVEYNEVTNEVSDILLQADELIAHEAPPPVIQPEPIDVPVPPVVIPEDEEADAPSEENESPENEEQTPDEDSDTSEDNENTDEEDNDDVAPIKKKKRFGWLIALILVIVVGALAFVGYRYYTNVYLQNIDELTLSLSEDRTLTVNITTTANESELLVTCTDTYGNARKASVVGGVATFVTLEPDRAYNIKVTISGRHQLNGKTTASIATPAETKVVQFDAITGKVDGSVILTFTLDGPDSEKWNVTYKTDGSATENIIFTGHSVTVKGLMVGREYEFTVTPVSDMRVIGNNSIKYMARAVVRAEDLTIDSAYDDTIFVHWNAPKNVYVQAWTVHCYNDTFDYTEVVKELNAAIKVPDISAEYTIEVTANEMSISSAPIRLPPNSTTITGFNVTAESANAITVSWTTGGTVPEGGIVLTYIVDGFGPTHLTIEEGNSVTIEPVIPGGKYEFEFTTAKGAHVFKGEYAYTAAKAQPFEYGELGIEEDSLTFQMCLDPVVEEWRELEETDRDFRNKFAANESISIQVAVATEDDEFEVISKKLAVDYITRNADGEVIDYTTRYIMWEEEVVDTLFKLDIPFIPQKAGEYTVEIYFNDGHIHTAEYTITE